MAIETTQLRVPGPTPIPQRVIRAMSRQMINHRGPEFAELITEIIAGLKWALRTQNEVLIFPGSGTAGLEAAVANLLSPEEPVLFCSMGSFGDRWVEIARIYGANVIELSVPWGQPIDPEDVEHILAKHPEVKKLFITHNETSTGVVNNLPAISAIAKARGLLIAVDSVSGAGCMPLSVDELGLDCVVTSSQKGWLTPPGITMIVVSPAAMEAAKASKNPRFYWDFAREQKFQIDQQTLTTPPISVLYALQEGLLAMREEGLDNIFIRHTRIANMIRAGVNALGLHFLAAEGNRSDTVTAVYAPKDQGAELSGLLKLLREKYGLVLAGGQGQLKGKIFRIGHMGAIKEADAYAILGTLEQGLAELNMLHRTGLAVAAAQDAIRQERLAPAGSSVATTSSP